MKWTWQHLKQWFANPAMRVALMLGFIFAPVVAFAQDAVASVTDPDVTVIAKAVWDAITNSKWGVVAAGAVILVVMLFRVYGKKFLPAKLAAYLDNPIVAWLLPVIVSMAGAVMNAMIAGLPWKTALWEGAKIGVAAIWAFIGVKKVQEVRAASKAAAAQAVPNKAAAVDALRRGPNP